MNYKNLNIARSNNSLKVIQVKKKIFDKMSLIRNFELEVFKHRQNNSFKTLIYLCLGQESIYASVSVALKNKKTFGQHRGHGIYLADGGNPRKLIDELVGLNTGTNQGMGGSPAIYDLNIGMYGHVGLIGDQVPVATGYSIINKRDIVVCYFGDGAAEEDYVLASFGFAEKKKSKIIYICDDNNLSVLTPIKDRRNWNISNVANSFGIKSFEITDDPLTIFNTISKIKKNNFFPALINIKTCREYWHEGAGKDKPSKNSWNRYQIFKNELIDLNLKNFILNTENKYKKLFENLWKKRLQRL